MIERPINGFLSLLNLITLIYLKIVQLNVALYGHVVNLYGVLPFGHGDRCRFKTFLVFSEIEKDDCSCFVILFCLGIDVDQLLHCL